MVIISKGVMESAEYGATMLVLVLAACEHVGVGSAGGVELGKG